MYINGQYLSITYIFTLHTGIHITYVLIHSERIIDRIRLLHFFYIFTNNSLKPYVQSSLWKNTTNFNKKKLLLVGQSFLMIFSKWNRSYFAMAYNIGATSKKMRYFWAVCTTNGAPPQQLAKNYNFVFAPFRFRSLQNV